VPELFSLAAAELPTRVESADAPIPLLRDQKTFSSGPCSFSL